MSLAEDKKFAEEYEQTTPNLLFQMVADLNEKLDRLADQFGGVHADEHRFIATLIAREEKRAKFHDAVIEKTSVGLVWMAIVAAGTGLWTYLKEHLK